MEGSEATGPPRVASCVGICDWVHCARVAKSEASDHSRRMCSALWCRRSVHAECLEDVLAPLALPSGFDGVVCSQRCYLIAGQSVSRLSETKKVSFSWHDDGSTPDACSSSILLKWLETGDNYEQYTTTTNKRKFTAEICREFEKQGIRSLRKPNDVSSEVSRLQREFRITTKWLAAKPQQQNLEAAMEAARILCPKYERLKAFMVPATHPKTHPSKAPCSDPKKKKKQRVATEDSSKPTVHQDERASIARCMTDRAEARIQAALSRATKLRQEAHFLRLQTTSLALHERIQLREEGVPQADIDFLIPACRHDLHAGHRDEQVACNVIVGGDEELMATDFVIVSFIGL